MFKHAVPGPELPHTEPHTEPMAFRAAMTILLVDDDAMVRTATRAVLTHAGFEVLSCEDGPAALSLQAMQPKIDVLLSDFQMPHMTGFALAEEMTRRSPRLSVVLLSGAEPGDIPLSAIAQHHWSFLPKPVNRPDLLATLDGLCGKRLRKSKSL